MKKKIIALISNFLVLIWSSHVFFTKVLAEDFELWRFVFSLSAMLVFLTFVILLIRNMIIEKNKKDIKNDVLSK